LTGSAGFFKSKQQLLRGEGDKIPQLAAGGRNHSRGPALSRWKIPLKENGLWARGCCFG